MSFTVDSSFIGDFKLGDNINYNLDLLALLYREHNANSENQKFWRKPIILTNVSITEALLHDLHYRIKTFTVEKVKDITDAISDYIQGKQLDELEKLIASARKHDLFSLADTNFYERMDELRKLRNRIHIQNRKKDFEPDDHAAFSAERMRQSERVLEKTAKVMAGKYGRGAHFDYVRTFTFPWHPHFPS
jgi:hypothetical protein